MIKLIVSDFDGTLIPLKNVRNNVIDSKVKQSLIAQMKKRKVIIATGRHPSFISKVIPDISFETIIGFSGNLTHQKERWIFQRFSVELVKQVLVFINQFDRKVALFMCSVENDFFYTSQNCFAYIKKKEALTNNQLKDIHCISKKTIAEWIGNPIEPICRICLSFQNKEERHAVENAFIKQFRNYTLVETGKLQLEVMKKNHGKAAEVLRIMKEMQIKQEEVAVIGDSYNDITMFQQFKNSFCIKNDYFQGHRYANTVVDNIQEVFHYIEKK